MRRKKSVTKAEIGRKVVSVEVVSDEELATVGGGFRPWGWWEVQPPTVSNGSYGMGDALPPSDALAFYGYY